MRNDYRTSRDDIVKPGDMITGIWPEVMVYHDENCEAWEDYIDDRIGICVSKHTNSFEHTVVKVLFPQGIRWLYFSNVKVMCKSEHDVDTM